MLIKRALKGGLPLIDAARRLQDELLAPGLAAPAGDGLLEAQASAIGMFRKVVLAVIGLALQTHGDRLNDEQELLSLAADIIIDTYAADSAVQRARAASASGISKADLHVDAATVYVNEAAMRIDVAARAALAAMAVGDTLRTHLAALRRLLKVTPVNAVTIRRRLADAAVARGAYPI